MWFTQQALGHSHYIIWSTSSDKGILYLVGGKKNKNKNWDFVSGRRKKFKKSWKVTFSIENQQISYKFL